MPGLPRNVDALAETVVDAGTTILPDLARTEHAAAKGAASPFASSSLVLPPAHVSFSGAPAADLDIQVVRVLAEGGMGRVYLAEQRTLAREVAIKTVKDPSDTAQTDALIWEGAITGHLDHPGVTPVHLLGAGPDGSPLLIMKRIVGLRWTELLALRNAAERIPTLPKDRLRAHVEILMEIARTLHHAHQRGVVHLDLKPDNVMIGDLGEVYVVDWGIATTLELAAAGDRQFGGTPAFIAPEVVLGTEVGPWTDVYLLGAALHVILTGRPRHEGESVREVLERALLSAPFAFDTSAPAELAALANRATSRDRESRPRDALAFRAALSDYLEHAESLALSHDGLRRLAELDGQEPRDANGARTLHLLTEARFAFRAALDRWPDNAEATLGLSRAHAATAELEVERENLAGAREAAAELASVPAPLAARLTALEERLRRRAESEEELRRVEQEQDLGRGARARYITVFGLSAAATVLTIVGGGLRPVDPSAYTNLKLGPFLGMPLAMTVAVIVVVLVFGRRTLLSNTIGRRTAGAFLAGMVGMIVHRAAMFELGAGVLPIVVGDLLIVATLFVGVSIFVTPRAWVGVALLLGGAAALAAWPSYGTLAFNTSCGLAVASIAWALQRRPAGSVQRRPS